MRDAGEFKAKLIRLLHRLLQVAAGIAGAYGGIHLFFLSRPVLPMDWLANHGVPLPGRALLPFMAFVWLAFATFGALVSVWLLGVALRRVFNAFERRLVES